MRAKPWAIILFTGLVAILLSTCQEDPPRPVLEDPISFLQSALQAHGGSERFIEEGATVTMTGAFDLTVRWQGRSPFRKEITPITEIITVAPGIDRVAYEFDGYNYYNSHQKLMEIHDDERRVLFVDKQAGRGGYLPRETVIDHKQRFARYIPNLLIQELLDNPERVYRGRGYAHDISYVTSSGRGFTLRFDEETQLLESIETINFMEKLEGKRRKFKDDRYPFYLEWSWSDYQEIDGLVLPQTLVVERGRNVLKGAAIQIVPGADPNVFKLDSFNIAPPPDELKPFDAFVPYGKRDPEVEPIAEGVYLLRNLRPGFAMMFVDIGDSVVAIDAPAGWYDMNQIPPLDWSPGDNRDALGHKYIKAIEKTVPGKPISHLILTHHHDDHISGMRPFLEKELTVMTGISAIRYIPGQTVEPPFKVMRVFNTVTRIEGARPIEIIRLPDGNPKADDFLVVYLPEEKILYTTAFIYPVPEAVFPPAESVELSIYFVNWLDSSGLDVEQIYNVHGMARVEDWHLDKLREIAASRN